MRIGVDIRGSAEYRDFIYGTFKVLTETNSQHTFIFIHDKPFDSSSIFSKNVIPEIITPAKISLLQQFKISSLLKKHKADVFVTQQLIGTNIPQCLIALDKATFKSLEKANVIVADSEFSKAQIIENYKINESEVEVSYNGVKEFFQPVELTGKEKIKEQYANGNEYFLSAITTKPDLLNLLKAFSVLKKMQKSSMHLLIVPGTGTKQEFSEALRLYKFKSEVKLLENIGKKELSGITGSAYAFVYPAGAYYHALPAMKSNVPVIAIDINVMQEIFGDAALYCNSNDHKDIADKIMLIYKDENLRQQLIEKGKEKVKKYSWDNAAESLWKSIEKAAN